jgi:hypothetical protein
MTEPVRPLEALIAEIKHLPRYWMKIPNAGQSQTQVICVVDLQRILDELAALLQAAAPPAPRAEQVYCHECRGLGRVNAGDVENRGDWETCSRCKGTGISQRETVIVVRDADHYASVLNEMLTAAPPERVSEGKET